MVEFFFFLIGIGCGLPVVSGCVVDSEAQEQGGAGVLGNCIMDTSNVDVWFY